MNAIRKATRKQLDYIEYLARDAGYFNGNAAWKDLRASIDPLVKHQEFTHLTLIQASALIDLLLAEGEDLREGTKANENVNAAIGCLSIIAIVVLGYFGWKWVSGLQGGE